MKTFSQKQIDLIRFAICILGAGILYGINLSYHAGYVNRWAVFALSTV